MNQDTFKRAKSRLQRAWNEASYRFNRRAKTTDKQTLLNVGSELIDSGKSISTTLEKLKEHPCATCRRCCTQAAFSSGFHTHTEREVLIARNEDNPDGVGLPEDYIVESWYWGEAAQPPERCLFLSPTGCNLPKELKSSQCTVYVCLDKLAPQLAAQGLEKEYKKARTKNVQALRVLQDNLCDLDFELNVTNLGEG